MNNNSSFSPPPPEPVGGGKNSRSPQLMVPSPVTSEPVASKPDHMKLLIWLTILLIAVTGGAVFIGYQFYLQQNTIAEISTEKNRLLEENRNLREQVDAKETFTTVAQNIYGEWQKMEGTPYKEKMGVEEVAGLVQESYINRENPGVVNGLTESLREKLVELQAFTNSMETGKTNVSGDVTETVTDKLSYGLVSPVYYSSSTTDPPCNQIASACVWNTAPEVINFNTDAFREAEQQRGKEFAEWWKTGIAYHEFAHILQNLNPVATETVLPVFDNNKELMADCYASVYFGGNKFITYNYNLGCTQEQGTTIQSWVGSLKATVPAITQN